MTGTTISHYRILEKLGEGGMGVVYKAEDIKLGRTVALKFLPADVADSEEQKARFLREARAGATLHHPNICTIFEIDEQNSFLAMECIEGQSLKEKIAERPLKLDQALDIAIQIGQGLQAAHERGVVHRDIKPGNVMVTPQGQAKIMDFGLAQLADRTRITKAGSALGTPAYMSPEQAQGTPTDRRTDIWSLGVVLYEMASGRLPFGGETEAAVARAILDDQPEPLTALRSGIPIELDRVVEKALAKDPADRYQHIDDMLVDLRSLRARLGEESRRPSRVSTPALPSVGPRRPRWFILAGGLAGAVALVAAWFVLRERQPALPANHRLISTFPGAHRSASFSPDGGLIAFISDASGTPQVWVKNLMQGDPIQITLGDVPAERPRWSPKNDQIVFARRGGGIWSVPPLGGPERQIVEQGRNANFSADGAKLVFEVGREIWVAKADGSGAQKLRGLPHKYYSVDASPAFSPDGRQIAFFNPEAGPTGDLWLIPAEGGEARRLTFDMRAGGTPVWTPDGRWIVFSSERAGSRTLWRVAPEGGEIFPVTTGAGEDSDPDISADGRKLVYTNVRNSWDLVLLDPRSGKRTELLSGRRRILFPMFAAAGDKIAFFQTIEGDAHIMTIDVDGANLRQVTHGKGQLNTMPRWSADGAHIYLYQLQPTMSFRRVPAAGGESLEVAPWSWETHNNAQVHPNGRSVVYNFRERGKESATVIRTVDTGEERILGIPLGRPRWSPDGRNVLGHHRGTVAICPVDGGSCATVTKGFWPAWSGDGSRIYFLRPGASPALLELWSAARDGRDERKIADLGPFFPIDVHFDVSRTDQIVYAPYREGRHELWLAEMP